MRGNTTEGVRSPEVRKTEDTVIERQYQQILLGLLRDGRHTALPEPMREIEELLRDGLPASFSPTAPPDYSKLLEQFASITEELREYVLTSALRGKSVAALGGSFSSGKSSLVNSLIHERVLPTEIVPTTAVATYVVQGKPHACAINRDYFIHHMEPEVVHLLAHGFYGPENDETDFPQEFAHHLRSITVWTDKLPYEHLALLDTPGYTGEQNADLVRTMIAGANALVWVVNAEAGTLTGEEIRFLQTLPPGLETLVVLSKCDKKTAYDIALIKRQVKAVLDQNAIRYTDLLTYSSRRPGDYDAAAISDFLAKWDTPSQVPQFAQSYYELYARALAFYADRQFILSRRLNKVNTAMSALAEPDANLSGVAQELRDEARELARQKELVLRNRSMVLDALNRLGKRIGTPFPQTEELAEIRRRTDALSLVRFEKEKAAIRSGDTFYRVALAFAGLDQRAQFAPGGVNHYKTLAADARRSLERVGNRPPRYITNLTGTHRYGDIIARDLARHAE